MKSALVVAGFVIDHGPAAKSAGERLGRRATPAALASVGITNEHSIAWGCAQAFKAAGAELAVTWCNDNARFYVEPLAQQIEAAIALPLDVEQPGQLEDVFEAIADRWGRLDFLLRSIAFAPKSDLHGRVVDSSREGFTRAMDISCHSLARMARVAEPLMKEGGSIMTMSYIGAEEVIPDYGLMGPVKAALESTVRYLAAELGARGIRVNAVSSGPLVTRAASGISHFDVLLAAARRRTRRRRCAVRLSCGRRSKGDNWQHNLYRCRLPHSQLRQWEQGACDNQNRGGVMKAEVDGPQTIRNRPFADIAVGDSACVTRTLTQEDLLLFAAVSGDFNPQHLDAEFAASTRFHGIIAHGMWGGALISAVLGTHLPGPGTVYLGQTLRFRTPVRVGDTLAVRVTVTTRDETKKLLTLSCKCTNQDGVDVIEGEATVLAPTDKIERPAIALPDVRISQNGASTAKRRPRAH